MDFIKTTGKIKKIIMSQLLIIVLCLNSWVLFALQMRFESAAKPAILVIYANADNWEPCHFNVFQKASVSSLLPTADAVNNRPARVFSDNLQRIPLLINASCLTWAACENDRQVFSTAFDCETLSRFANGAAESSPVTAAPPIFSGREF